jgi:hypothetical protein
MLELRFWEPRTVATAAARRYSLPSAVRNACGGACFFETPSNLPAPLRDTPPKRRNPAVASHARLFTQTESWDLGSVQEVMGEGDFFGPVRDDSRNQISQPPFFHARQNTTDACGVFPGAAAHRSHGWLSGISAGLPFVTLPSA